MRTFANLGSLLAGSFMMLAVGCAADVAPTDTGTSDEALTTSVIKHVFVIAMENHGASQIYTNKTSAPYITGTLIPEGGRATNFIDVLPQEESEPHYVWMEAGTNSFSDHTFTTDSAPSATNSTSSKAHLVTQIKNATNGVTWMSYQEDLTASTTGACPIASGGHYAPKHDPFVFFQDVSGNPPSKTNSYCAAHHKPYSALANDLANNKVASYVFITPNLCHDMHSNTCAGSSDPIKQGDDWLKANVPAILSYCNAHAGALLIVWDEPAGSTGTIPLLVLGPPVKRNHTSSI
jgi:hypothetical protein